MVNNPQRRTKGAERQIQEGSVPLKQMAQFGVESLPGVGEVLAAKRVGDAIEDKDYAGAGIEAAAGLVGLIPGVGDLASKGIRKFRRLNLNEDQLFDKRNVTEKSLDQHLNLEGESSTSHYITPDGTFADAVNEHDEFASEFGKDAKSIALENGLIRSGGVFRARGLEGSPLSFSAEIIEGQPITREQKRVMRNAVDNVDIAYLDISDDRGNVISALKSKPEIKNYIRQLEVSEPDPSYVAGPLDIGVNEGLVDGKLLKRDTMQTLDEVQKAAKKATVSSGKHLVGKKVKEGTKVGIRLNLNSKIPDGPAGIEKLQTVHKNNYDGKALSYVPFATVKNAKFNVNQKGRQSIAAKIEGLDVPEAKTKHNMASVDGEFTKENVLDAVVLDDVVEIGFNPKNTHLYIDLATGQAVKEAELATVVGNRVYATGVKYMKKSEAPQPLSASDGTPLPSEVRYKFKQGGAVPMNTMAKQMELFEPVERAFDEGGLMDEGGTVDPVSGNEVPPGSTQEEVRDDVPAQLSEGEFVFPADVVRYIGLETLMRMRQEAKMGLAQMEAMGQMGNSEEAIIPDDLPFDMYDLDIEDDGLEMQVGGVVPAPMSTAMGTTTTGGSFNPQTNQFVPSPVSVPAPVGTAATPIRAASDTRSPTDPNLSGTKFTPTSLQTVLPTFQQTIGGGVINVDYELVEFTNDAGQIILLKVDKKTGEVLDPIPEGFYKKTEKVEKKVTPDTTLGTGVQTTKVLDQGGGDGSTGMGGLEGPSKSAVEAVMSNLSPEYAELVSKNTINSLVDLAKPMALVNQIINDFNKAQVKSAYIDNLAKDREKNNVPVMPGFKNHQEQIKAEIKQAEEELDRKLKGLTKQQREEFKQYMEEEQANQALESLADRTDEDATFAELEAISEMAKTGTIPDDVQAEIDAALEAQGRPDLTSDNIGKKGEDDFGIGTKGEFDTGPSAPSDPGISDDPDPETGITGPEADAGAGKGGPVGGGGGAGSEGASGTGCFAAGTKFFMHDGSLKSVENIKVGDVMMDGGKVRLSIIGDGSNSDWYMYGATKVTGSHAVKEQGVWKFTRDTENAVPAETEDLLYTIVNTHHRMIAEDKVIYADYDMVDEDGIEEELLEMMNLQEVVKEAA